MKNKKRRYYLKSTIIIVFLILLNSVLFLLQNNPTLEIKGNEVIELSLMDEYHEIGFDALSCGVKDCTDLSDFVTIDSNIDNTKIGEYDINYNLTYNNKNYSTVRKVKVVDDISPEIKLNGSDTIHLCPNKDYIEEGYIATDNYDGLITDKVTIETDNNTILYKVSDLSGNQAEAKRTIVREDNQKPLIELKGKNVVNLKVNEKYIEEGYTATDNCDGDITEKVIVKSNVNTSKAGTYTIKYSIKDNNGNEYSVSRTVIVKKVVTIDNNTNVNNPTNNTNNNTNVNKPTNNTNNNTRPNKEDYLKELEEYIKQKNYKVSIGYVNLNTGYTYTYKPNTIYYGASLVKTVGALYAYENMTLDSEIRELVRKAISISDNAAHGELTRKIGITNLRAYGQSLGAKNFLTKSDDDFYGNTTVDDQITIWKYLYNFINTNPEGPELKRYFINSFYNNLLFENSPTIMHKYGYYGVYYHDVGIVYSDQPYIVVILTKEAKKNYKLVVKDLSKKMYEFNKIDR